MNPLVNVEGGAIAHGHPIGATGALLTTRLIHSMRRDGLQRGIVTLCIGGGQGIALALETLLAATVAVRLRPVSHEDDMHLISQE
jgi:acetyl-CoA acetyltransferase